MKDRLVRPRCKTALLPRRGLTLLELVVVLAVLAAVAAIVAPMLPNLLRCAHKATDATQTGELSKAVQTYNALYYSYPSNFDMLTTGTAFPSYLPGFASSTGPFGGFVQLGTLTSAEADALNSVGITTVQKLATTATQPTLNPYGGTMVTDAISLASESATPTSSFAIIDFSVGAASGANILAGNPRFLEAVRTADPTARYVVFGVGSRSQMIGQVIQDAPTSVPQKKGFTPANTYARVGVIFKVSGLEVTNADNRAKFIAAVALEDDELEATEKDTIGYYEVSAGTGN